MAWNFERARLCTYEARAWVGEQLVAVSSAAMRVDLPESAPVLYFPIGDLREPVPSDADVLLPAAQ